MREIPNTNTMRITMRSQLSGIEHTMDIQVTESELNRIRNRFNTRELIQNIVPNLSMDEREFLLSGITPTEWNNTFGNPNL